MPTLFVIVGAQLKQVAGVPEYVSGAVGITTKLIATGLVALYWLPDSPPRGSSRTLKMTKAMTPSTRPDDDVERLRARSAFFRARS